MLVLEKLLTLFSLGWSERPRKAHQFTERGDVTWKAPLLAEPHSSAKTGGRRRRRNEADAANPAPLISPRFEQEHEHEHDDEDDLVAAPRPPYPACEFLGFRFASPQTMLRC